MKCNYRCIERCVSFAEPTVLELRLWRRDPRWVEIHSNRRRLNLMRHREKRDARIVRTWCDFVYERTSERKTIEIKLDVR